MEIELSKAVSALRDELLEAAANGVDRDLNFVVGPIDLEFAVELRKDAKAKAGFKAWVVSADVEGGVARVQTHRVKVQLTPKSVAGGDLLISSGSGGKLDPGDFVEHQGR